jgi:hypothetical protein
MIIQEHIPIAATIFNHFSKIEQHDWANRYVFRTSPKSTQIKSTKIAILPPFLDAPCGRVELFR